MALVITVAGVDRTRSIRSGSLRIVSVLTNSPDTAEFLVPKFGDRTFTPDVDDEVIITNDGTRIFGGHIMQMDETFSVLNSVDYRVKCIDYTKHIDQRLVVDTYENMTVQAIVTAIRNTYMPSDVDVSNVTVTTLIPYIAFNYEYPSDCLRQLAELSGADWRIDYNKNLYFQEQATDAAPFSLSDTNGRYIYNSLRMRKDLTQLRNVIYVRGGEYQAVTTTAAFVAETNQKHYLLPYKFSDLVVSVTGQSKSVGIDPIDPETEYDALHNFQEKMVKFREDRKPSAGSAVRISGRPYLPVIYKLRDPGSIATFTAREYAVVDRSINSREGAQKRALAELLAYKSTISEGSFDTYDTGLEVGQQITVQSDLRGIDASYVINRVETSDFSQDASNPGSVTMVHRIGMVSTRTYDYINLLQRLLNEKKKNIIVSDLETLDTVEAVTEAISMSELVVTTTSHNPIAESVSFGESVSTTTGQATEFVLGPYSPSGVKRVFILDGSPLG